jgi:hypothetical protein
MESAVTAKEEYRSWWTKERVTRFRKNIRKILPPKRKVVKGNIVVIRYINDQKDKLWVDYLWNHLRKSFPELGPRKLYDRLDLVYRNF